MNTREEFGKYLLLKKLADDPLGESFRAGRLGQQGLEQVVLLRVFNGQGLDTGGLWKILSARQDLQGALKSPNIGSGVDGGQVLGVPYVAYDYISGKDLAALIAKAARENSPFPTDHALLIADRIGLALTAAYEARHGGDRVLHGMVVPQLTMVSNEGETRLLGFEAGPGLAAQAASLPEGIQRYLAPEVRGGGAPSKASDVFSLGAILLELLTGRAAPLTTSEGYASLIDQARLASEGTPLPPAVAALLKRSLAPVAQRISDAPNWHKLLSKVMSDGGYNATTFNLAFFMHNLFRDEIERESREIEAEKTLELPVSQISGLAAGGAETTAIPREVVNRASPAAAAAPDDTAAVRARYGLEGAGSEEPKGGSKKGLWIAVVAAVVVAAVAAGLYFTVFAPKSEQPAAQPPLPVAQAQMPVAEAQQEEPPAPTPDPAELQAQIDKMVEEKTQAMEASLKEQYDKKITDMQNQLQDAQKAAAERARREEEAAQAAEEARKKAAAEQTAKKPAPAQTVTPPAEATGMAGQDQTAGQGAQGAAGSSQQSQPAQQPSQPAPQPKPAPAQPAVRVGELVQGGPGVVPPRVVRRAAPQFPPVAARLNKTATVDVRVLVDENGKVADAEIEGRKVGFGFDRAALSAARASSYEAATKYGVKVKMWVTVRFVFGR